MKVPQMKDVIADVEKISNKSPKLSGLIRKAAEDHGMAYKNVALFWKNYIFHILRFHEKKFRFSKEHYLCSYAL